MGKLFVRVEYEDYTTNEYFVYEDVWYDYLHKALENDKAVTHIETYAARAGEL